MFCLHLHAFVHSCHKLTLKGMSFFTGVYNGQCNDGCQWMCMSLETEATPIVQLDVHITDELIFCIGCFRSFKLFLRTNV